MSFHCLTCMLYQSENHLKRMFWLPRIESIRLNVRCLVLSFPSLCVLSQFVSHTALIFRRALEAASTLKSEGPWANEFKCDPGFSEGPGDLDRTFRGLSRGTTMIKRVEQNSKYAASVGTRPIARIVLGIRVVCEADISFHLGCNVTFVPYDTTFKNNWRAKVKIYRRMHDVVSEPLLQLLFLWAYGGRFLLCRGRCDRGGRFRFHNVGGSFFVCGGCS